MAEWRRTSFPTEPSVKFPYGHKMCQMHAELSGNAKTSSFQQFLEKATSKDLQKRPTRQRPRRKQEVQHGQGPTHANTNGNTAGGLTDRAIERKGGATQRGVK